jgi:hypothetical protein
MKKVPHFERLYRRGSTYLYRVSIPIDLRPHLGGVTEIKRSLRTDSLSEAKIRWATVHREVQSDFAAARHKVSELAQALRSPSASEIWYMVDVWRRARLEQERDILAKVSPSDYPARIKRELEHDTLWRQTGAVGRFHAMAADIVVLLCERSQLLPPKPGSGPFNEMAGLVHRARADTCMRMIALMEGDLNDNPTGYDRIFSEPPDAPANVVASDLNPGSKPGRAENRLSDLIRQYETDPGRSAKERTRKQATARLELLKQFCGPNTAVWTCLDFVPPLVLV